jgi:hypothetical protein
MEGFRILLTRHWKDAGPVASTLNQAMYSTTASSESIHPTGTAPMISPHELKGSNSQQRP